MNPLDLLSVVIGAISLLITVIGVPGFVLAWVQASDEAKEKFRSVWTWIRRKVYRGWVYFSCFVLVATGIWKMVEFVISSEPMTRLDFFLLLMNFMSLGVFTVASLAVIVMFQLEDKKQAQKLVTP
ncbi:hypothetical protein [Pseudomonas orientalis]|uniref:Uncharacterized protein n=1 Tax=Pseudomonas orientalis TaxID=76758 RepID=A0A1H2GRR4_9PSED|nr:hypothetical protein [Pseudomonas orientalis]KRP62632.1 hypothetical protein TU82_22075 [Pseudomonas orientalis]SDU22018.1 hypothetical protein SAMN04490197_3939 [Pseudomonas orientalis]